MMLVVGFGLVGYVFVIFYLFIYGFFKVGMFFGVGLVMYGMNDCVEMRCFGGLSGVMKIIWIIFGLGWLVILGVLLFVGFWSKDKIIEVVFIGEGWCLWVFGFVVFVGVGIIVFYMLWLFFMIFYGKWCWEDDVYLYELFLLMMVLMMVLVVGLVFFGLIFGFINLIINWLVFVVGEYVEGELVFVVFVLMVVMLLFVICCRMM